ncbi:MAG: hypothetical protein KGL44_10260 [Sphingomonadales bacterium]|nr:hypothetical protein [Sphingomonadales bacterium]
MKQSTAQPGTPRHLWIVGVLSLLWNSMGALDYTMTKLGNQAWLKNVPPETLSAIAAYPPWATAAWALGVWGSLLGSVLLLMRSRHALTALLVSLAGLAFNTLAMKLGGLPVVSGLAAAIWAALLGLIWYVWGQQQAGVLR